MGLYYGYIMLQEFKDELLFVTVSNNEAQIVVSKKVLTNVQASTFIEKKNKELVLKEAVKIIKSDVLDLVQSAYRGHRQLKHFFPNSDNLRTP